VVVRRLDMLKVEAIARAYLTGGGLEEYRAKGSVSGVVLPAGLEDGSRLPEPVFTPTTKAPVGQHDLPMTPSEVEAELGLEVAAEVAELTCAILARGNEIAAERGILIADTKVEFGRAPGGANGGLMLADEVLTPDSSRFWPAAAWQPGRAQPSYDKQFVRDWLTSPESGWSKASGDAPPTLPERVVEQTRAKYVEAYELLTGETF
jgi:phosphoribosylaminoimidazole-succinocarboxamide synthase